jgi:hypothetical protein
VLSRTDVPKAEGTVKVKTTSQPRPVVSADGDGVVSHAGSGLLIEVADRLGLTAALSRSLAPMRRRGTGYDPGAVIRDLAVSIADGGDCLSDLDSLREQPDVFGVVASNPTAWRVLDAVATTRGIDPLQDARAQARARAWKLGMRPKRVVLDFDATLVTAHSDKQGAAGTYKRGFGFHPLLCTLDGTDEILAAVLRPGSAGSNTAADHIAILDVALAQLPPLPKDEKLVPMLARADSAGATHGFLDALCERGIRFSVGFDLTEPVREAVLAMPADAWMPALTQGGKVRKGAAVCELTNLDLSAWPTGTRAICRRERPHPGAQLTFTDHDGHRFQVFITDQQDTDIVALEVRHRAHARVEDRIRCAKDTGLRNLPFRDFSVNELWLELVLTAQNLLVWMQRLCLRGEATFWEPKRLRHRLLHVAARLTRGARQVHLRLQRTWRWSGVLRDAFARLRALPAL